MRKFGKMLILCATLGIICSVNVMAQDSTKTSMKTVFGGKNAKTKINYLGIYIAPEYQYGQLDGVFSSMTGMSAMLQLNKKLGIGLTGFGGGGSRTDTTRNGGDFGGLKLEYTPKPDAPVHVSFPLVLGMGMTGGRGYRANDGRRNGGKHGDMDDFYVSNVEHTAYTVIQPGVMAEANLFRYAKVFAGASYRFAFNSAGSSTNLQGFSVNTGLKIGIFDYSLKKRVKKTKKTEENTK